MKSLNVRFSIFDISDTRYTAVGHHQAIRRRRKCSLKNYHARRDFDYFYSEETESLTVKFNFFRNSLKVCRIGGGGGGGGGERGSGHKINQKYVSHTQTGIP